LHHRPRYELTVVLVINGSPKNRNEQCNEDSNRGFSLDVLWIQRRATKVASAFIPPRRRFCRSELRWITFLRDLC